MELPRKENNLTGIMPLISLHSFLLKDNDCVNIVRTGRTHLFSSQITHILLLSHQINHMRKKLIMISFLEKKEVELFLGMFESNRMLPF
jgi:hypothetical protein